MSCGVVASAPDFERADEGSILTAGKCLENLNVIIRAVTNWSNLVAVMDWGGANSRFLGSVSVWAARSFDQTALRPSVIKRIRQIDVKYITHITSFGVTCVNTHV